METISIYKPASCFENLSHVLQTCLMFCKPVSCFVKPVSCFVKPVSCFVYVLNDYCHRVTTQLQLINIIIIIIIITCNNSSYLQWPFSYLAPCTYFLLTDSMEQSPSLEANQFSPSKKLPAFYGTRRFITSFTSARHLSLS
jgi:hypothetical protein